MHHPSDALFVFLPVAPLPVSPLPGAATDRGSFHEHCIDGVIVQKVAGTRRPA